jgi:hypothetical protein
MITIFVDVEQSGGRGDRGNNFWVRNGVLRGSRGYLVLLEGGLSRLVVREEGLAEDGERRQGARQRLLVKRVRLEQQVVVAAVGLRPGVNVMKTFSSVTFLDKNYGFLENQFL